MNAKYKITNVSTLDSMVSIEADCLHEGKTIASTLVKVHDTSIEEAISLVNDAAYNTTMDAINANNRKKEKTEKEENAHNDATVLMEEIAKEVGKEKPIENRRRNERRRRVHWCRLR